MLYSALRYPTVRPLVGRVALLIHTEMTRIS